MCRRCPNGADSIRHAPRGPLLAALLGFLLSACGSLPTGSDRDTADAAEQEGSVAQEPVLPAEAVQQFEQAVALMTSGDLAQAEQRLRTLAAAYPTYSGPLLNLGILHARAGQLEEAERAIREAITRNANNAAAFNQLGIVYRKLGRFKEADEAYTRAVQIDPDYALAYLNLGVLCDLYLQEPQRALEAYERYLSLAESPDAKVNGWVNELRKRIGAAPRSAQTNEASNRQSNDQDVQ
jgi:tetratricopeptide (TPR) repeat protein